MNPALKKKLYHYAMVTLACAIMGIAMNTFYMPNKMLSGGIGGVAVLAYYVAGLPMGATSLICNVPLFFLAYKYMDREYTISALYGIIAFSVSLDFFHFLSTYTVVHDKLLACIAGGVLYGIGAACMYRVGGSSDGYYRRYYPEKLFYLYQYNWFCFQYLSAAGQRFLIRHRAGAVYIAYLFCDD